MKFTFEIDDDWMEERYLSEVLTAELQRQVIHAILKHLDERISKEITKKVEETITAMISPRIDGAISEFVAKGTMLKNGQEISVVDHLRALFQGAGGWNNIGDHVARQAKAIGDELKKRYDVAFANQIVVRIHEQGLLKEDVAKLLLQ